MSAPLPLVAPRQPPTLLLPWEACRPALVIMDSLYNMSVHNHVSMSDALRNYLQVEWEVRRNMGERVGGQPRVLPPDAAFSKSGQSLAIDRAAEILKKRGEQPRIKQNRLIFLAAEPS